MGGLKSVFTIEPSSSFLETLATEIWRLTDGDGFLLSKYLILLPTRRSCRYLGLAFAQVAKGSTTLLPRMQPLGDIDEDEITFADDLGVDLPPAIAPLKRLMLLTQHIQRRDTSLSLDQAAEAAKALARFLDQIQIERCDIKGLPDLVQERELAEHWQQTVHFLEIVTKNWPLILAEHHCLDPAERRNAVLEMQAHLWRAAPPDFPVIAAGSTGSIPATADLLDVIASMPTGTVILPGLDKRLDDEAWNAIEETHPQHTMKLLLKKMQVERPSVRLYGAECVESSRTVFLSEAMRPASRTESWRTLAGQIDASAIKGFGVLTLNYPQEEAQVIALRLREILEHPKKTAALVTADRDLAVRVGALLQRWDVVVDDSGGTPLSMLPIGSFLNLVLAASAPQAGSVDLLSVLKHPLAACGFAPVVCRTKAREAELRIRRAEAEDFGFLKDKLAPLTSLWKQPVALEVILKTHVDVCEAVAASDAEGGAHRLWKGESEEEAAAWFDEWRESAQGFPDLRMPEYLGLFRSLSSSKTFRSGRAAHPRLSILGPLEARLIHVDFVILGGLSENIWPPDIGFDPWMSRGMRKKFKMTTPEYRIGLSAHDFVQACASENVLLTRSLRKDGVPTLPSRFILQIDTVLRAAALSSGGIQGLEPSEPWRSWAHRLDAPKSNEFIVISRPQPRPALHVRPSSLAITDIGIWLRNPYAIYAKYILKLAKLDELDTELDASDKGVMIHRALEVFVRAFPTALPPDAEGELLKIGRQIFLKDKSAARVRAFWWARFVEIAQWYVQEERRRLDEKITLIAAEPKGTWLFKSLALRGRADRIDRRNDGSLIIIDYKTGSVPSKTEVLSGLEPQLQLLSLMASDGNFEGVAAGPTGSLEYWSLKGGKSGCKVIAFKDEQVCSLREHAEKGLARLISEFAMQQTPYEAVPKPRIQPRYNDYAHLSRLAEWGRTEGDP